MILILLKHKINDFSNFLQLFLTINYHFVEHVNKITL